MKRFGIKSFTSILLVLALILSMSACGSTKESTGQNSTGTADTTKESAADAATTAAEQAPDPFGKYEPGIELTAAKWTVAEFKYPEGDDISNNPYSREFEKALGIKVNYIWTTDQTQYGNKLNVSIASGDIPDYFTCDSKTFISLAKSGQLADLTDAYEKYASPDIKNYGNAFIEGFNSAKFDGKLQALPMLGFGTIALPTILWIRDDWMKSENLTAPQTMDELIKMAEAFKSKHPNSYGFAVEKDLRTHINSILGFANAYHAYPGNWIKDASGQITYGSVQPEMKTLLKVLQDLYKNGLLDKEFAVKDINKVNEDIVSGKVGIMFGPQWACYWPFPDAVKSDPNAVWKPYPVPSADGQPVLYQGAWPITEYLVVNKKCENPEAIVKMANLYMKWTNENSFPSEKYNNMNWQSSPVYYNNPMSDYDKHVRIAEAIKTKDTSKLLDGDKSSYDQAISWVDKKDPNGFGAYFQLSSEGSYGVIKKLVDENRIKVTELRGPDTPSYAEKKATLDKLELDTFTKIIMGASLDEFDKFVDNWKTLGGDAAAKEINELYNK